MYLTKLYLSAYLAS